MNQLDEVIVRVGRDDVTVKLDRAIERTAHLDRVDGASFDLTAGAPRTLDEFKVLAEALTQYLENATDPEDRSETEAARVAAAQTVLDRLTAEWAVLADE